MVAGSGSHSVTERGPARHRFLAATRRGPYHSRCVCVCVHCFVCGEHHQVIGPRSRGWKRRGASPISTPRPRRPTISTSIFTSLPMLRFLEANTYKNGAMLATACFPDARFRAAVPPARTFPCQRRQSDGSTDWCPGWARHQLRSSPPSVFCSNYYCSNFVYVRRPM